MFIALLSAFTLAACNSGSMDSTDVTGVVFNGLLVGANVEILDGNGESLGQTVTDTNGEYSLSTLASGPFLVEASGGTHDNRAYQGALRARCEALPCHVTPFSTALLTLMEHHGFGLGDARALLAPLLGFDGDPFVRALEGNPLPAAVWDMDVARVRIASGEDLIPWVGELTAWALAPDDNRRPAGVPSGFLADYCSSIDEPPAHMGAGASGTRGWEAWKEFGTFGQGVRVGVSSTGVTIEHEALTANYAGTLPNGNFNHHYAWFDAVDGALAPTDPFQIGTHLTGTIAGIDPERCFGVAPRTEYMACKVFDGTRNESAESNQACLGWFLEPRDLNGENPRPDLRPDVLLASDCADCRNTELLLPQIQQLRAAGTVVVTASTGTPQGSSRCAKILTEPAYHPEVITITALDEDGDSLATSAAGPGIRDEQPSIQKPDLATLGAGVESSVFINDESLYFPASGSPVAASVATGVVAMVISANPQLKRQPRLVEEILYSTAKTRVDSQCQTDNEAEKDLAPNNEFGYGAIDAFAAVKRAMAYPYGGCPAQPVEACSMNGPDASFSVSQTLAEAPDEQQQVAFRYHAGESLAGRFGEPDRTKGEAIRLCIYDKVDDLAVPTGRVLNSGLKLGTGDDVAAGSWSRSGNPGAVQYRFDGPSIDGNDGIVTVELNEEVGAIEVIGLGVAMPLARVRSPTNNLERRMYEAEGGVVVQAHSTASGKCWGADFGELDIDENNIQSFIAGKGELP